MTHVPVIAIVDDDASVRRALQRLIESAGYTVHAFASAREYLDWMPQEQAACLVLDIHMDGMNGFELEQRVTVPVIFITAHDDALTLERIKRSRAASHLRKPIDSHAVLNAIGRAVDGLDQGPTGETA